MKKLYPKCLNGNIEFGNTTRGYILPCCWIDTPDLFEGDFRDLVKEKFKLSSVNDIEEIVKSDEWTKFYNNLKIQKAPKHCYEICGKDSKMYGTK